MCGTCVATHVRSAARASAARDTEEIPTDDIAVEDIEFKDNATETDNHDDGGDKEMGVQDDRLDGDEKPQQEPCAR